MEMSSVLTFAFPRSAGEIPGIYVIKAKRQCNENITNCKGKRRRFYQLAVRPVWGLFLAGFLLDIVSKSPLFLEAGGRGYK